MNTSFMADDPLYTSIYHAVAAAKQSRQQLYAATSCRNCNMALMRLAADIEKRMAGDSIFDAHFESELRELAKMLTELAQDEQENYYVHDEHCISPSMEMTRQTDWGAALLTAQASLVRLADAVSDVHCHLAAERLAFAFRA